MTTHSIHWILTKQQVAAPSHIIQDIFLITTSFSFLIHIPSSQSYKGTDHLRTSLPNQLKTVHPIPVVEDISSNAFYPKLQGLIYSIGNLETLTYFFVIKHIKVIGIWWNSNSTCRANYQMYITSFKLIFQSMLNKVKKNQINGRTNIAIACYHFFFQRHIRMAHDI